MSVCNFFLNASTGETLPIMGYYSRMIIVFTKLADKKIEQPIGCSAIKNSFVKGCVMHK